MSKWRINEERHVTLVNKSEGSEAGRVDGSAKCWRFIHWTDGIVDGREVNMDGGGGDCKTSDADVQWFLFFFFFFEK